MTRSPANASARRRPPAIEPTRKVLRIDPAAEKSTRSASETVTAELPNVVLRIPEIVASAPAEPRPESSSSQSETVDRLKILGVAAALVLLAVLLFSSAEQSGNRRVEPLSPTPLAPAAASPDQQYAPPWQAPVVAAPPVPTTPNAPSGADPPVYRTAERLDSGVDRYERPRVRFEGSIEKQTPEIRHERP